MSTNYEYLVGKTKKEIVKEFGQEFNLYHSSIWTYMLGKDWIGRNEILIITFTHDDIVGTIQRRFIYGKININKL